MSDPLIKVAFVSCQEQQVEAYLRRMGEIFSELPLWVVSEFPPPTGRWIPYKPNRSFGENLARIRAALRGSRVKLSAVVLEPKSAYPEMRWLAFVLAPIGFLAFNTALDNFMLRPRCVKTIAGHFFWRWKENFDFQTHPGGTLYTWVWRLGNPRALRRPLMYWAAVAAGWLARMARVLSSPRQDARADQPPEGISVVIPSRNGKELVMRLLPGLLPQLPENGEVIVVDNGSDDGTAAELRSHYPRVRVEESPAALSFATAVNRGIRAAAYSHVCLLNNDMIVEPGFLDALRRAFAEVPELFCATAQIFFPEGMRRQETGKAVWWSERDGRALADFPVRCIDPIPGENYSWVLYGSGGCSLYDAAKLRQIGGFDESLAPAYVEDLDIGWRGWQRNWPTVYVDGARVTHFHRSTTTRYYKPELLQSFVDYNFLRFLARHVATPGAFAGLWSAAIRRLNLLAVKQAATVAWAEDALAFAWKAARLLQPGPKPLWPEEWILAVGSGACAVFPGRAASGKPRVMVVSPYLPFPLSHGGAVRIYNLMRCAADEFDQVLVAFVDDLQTPPAELLELACEIVLVRRHGTHLFPDRGRPDVVEEFQSAAMEAAIIQTVRKWQPGVAQLEFTWMAQYAAQCKPARTVLVEHDITYDLQRQLLDQGEDWETRRHYGRWLSYEKAAWREVDAVAVMSEKDRREVGNEKAVLLANGVDLARFQASGRGPEARRLLFIGSFAHLPNVLALDFFLRECWPLIDSLQPVLHIIAGSRHEYYLQRCQDTVRLDLGNPRIEVEGFVSDVRPAYERAAVVIAPLVASAGTNIKIMEAMAMRKAIVTTPAGINGLDLENGRDVLVAQTGEQFAAAIRELMEHPERRGALEDQARRTVERDFDWRAIGARQAELYRKLLRQP
ncbi:MAG: glycosyltransferase [Candidatus Solibacter usitatus]|nr:glycosyltransferase [Candidatus Solibacter usitatus]